MIENSLSNEVVLTLNVPEGSILGPSENSDFTEPVGHLQMLQGGKTWMTSNYLKLSDDKTEVIIVGTKAQLQKSNINKIDVCNSKIAVKNSVKTKLVSTLILN